MGNRQSSTKSKSHKKLGKCGSRKKYKYQDVTDCEPEYSPKEKEQQDNISKYDLPFENIVLEGGGVKGVAYCGAIRVLERTGVWPKIKRIGGASAGSIMAALLAVGYDSYDLERFLTQDLDQLFQDAPFGKLSMLPNLMRRFGWHPADRLFNWLGRVIKDATWDPDITFMQVYEKFGRELCIVTSNLNQMSTMYCHPKTTPDMPIRLAVRMSSSIPIMFQAVKYQQFSQWDYYVDGGLLCNYPVHCFDGWYLSMDPEDSFLHKLHPISEAARLFDKSERFGTFNEKTLGFLLYSTDEPDVMQVTLEERQKDMDPPVIPDTKLARKRIKKDAEKKVVAECLEDLSYAAERFLTILRQNFETGDHDISYEELKSAVAQMTEEDLTLLFNNAKTAEEIFSVLDVDTNGKITFNELIYFLERNNVFMVDQFMGFKRIEIKGITEFANAIQDALLLNAKQNLITARDIERTVGINNLYLQTTDFNMEKEDRILQVQQGRRATIAYLNQYVQKNSPPLKSATAQEMVTISEEANGKPAITLDGGDDNANKITIDDFDTPDAPLPSPVTKYLPFRRPDMSRQSSIPYDYYKCSQEQLEEVEESKRMSRSSVLDAKEKFSLGLMKRRGGSGRSTSGTIAQKTKKGGLNLHHQAIFRSKSHQHYRKKDEEEEGETTFADGTPNVTASQAETRALLAQPLRHSTIGVMSASEA